LSKKSSELCSASVKPKPGIRPAATLHTTSMSMLQQNGVVRKTLGVRRTMNGWDSRKNK
jgi:DNA helicase-2/ATP-dependent DNA helicase PcrA